MTSTMALPEQHKIYHLDLQKPAGEETRESVSAGHAPSGQINAAGLCCTWTFRMRCRGHTWKGPGHHKPLIQLIEPGFRGALLGPETADLLCVFQKMACANVDRDSPWRCTDDRIFKRCFLPILFYVFF